MEPFSPSKLNTSGTSPLTSAAVKEKLKCDGELWGRKELEPLWLIDTGAQVTCYPAVPEESEYWAQGGQRYLGLQGTGEMQWHAEGK